TEARTLKTAAPSLDRSLSPSPSTERGPGGEVAPAPTSNPQHPTPIRRTILFIDEIHRFNKAQQDAVLPYVEDGTVTLIGATTENPSFEVIGPLLSRSRVFTLKALEEPQLAELLRRALTDPDRGLGNLNVEMDDAALEALAASVGGDARIALNALEAAVMSVTSGVGDQGLGDGEEADPRSPQTIPSPNSPSLKSERDARQRGRGSPEPSPTPNTQPPTPARVTRAVIEEALQHRTYLYDRQGDAHYDTISAFIKSLRGSDPDGALYWLARMIEAGEDPLFIVRRMVILASEDVGLADPQAMSVATACQQAVHFIGMPEGFYPMAECALYLALAPKSNSVGASYGRALADVEATRNDPIPMHLRNAVTGSMKGMGYGRGYQYAHDYEGGVAPDQAYLPDRLKGRKYYVPRPLGREKDLADRHAQAQTNRPSPPPPQQFRSGTPHNAPGSPQVLND
ncbi:MAG TPA: replication-associated recombination protein A, partial [Dehalococcoidia bacterium]|nr:replication-associated recombination protein A [Dehalococcoidia bacterium]